MSTIQRATHEVDITALDSECLSVLAHHAERERLRLRDSGLLTVGDLEALSQIRAEVERRS